MNKQIQIQKEENLANFANLQEKSSLLYEFWRAFRKNKLAVFSIFFLVIIILTAIFAPFLATHDPGKIDLAPELQKLPPSAKHFLGTDDMGRDVWSRILFGSRISLIVGFMTVLIAVTIGSIYGSISGYYGGRVDMVMMRIVDILLSLPTMFLLIILAAFVKPNVFGIALIIGCTSWESIARIVRGQFLSLKQQDFTEAARALGFSNKRIIFKHILPNVTAQIIVYSTLLVATAILVESTLSFLGLGIQPPQFSWGSMLTNVQDLILLKDAPWTAFFPGLAIFITVLAFNFFGDGLRDAVDPKLKNVRD